jgi:hypothetical protein
MPPPRLGFFQHLTTLNFWRLLVLVNVSKNAKFALVIAEARKNERHESDAASWSEFLAKVPKLARPNQEAQTIHDNVWLIPMDTGIPFLVRLFDLANSSGIHLRILFLDAEPDWIQYPPDIKPDAWTKSS